MSNIARLLDKLEQLRQAVYQPSSYGATDHRYQLGPTIAEVDLAQFERLHRVALPADYREFLMHAGDVGAGPDYGLYSLKASVISAEADFLARPFPYQHWWNGIDPPDWWNLPNAQDLDLPQQADYGDSTHVLGTLRLAHEGCGYYSFLVVSGAERGHMWSDGRAGDGGLHPLPYHPGPSQSGGIVADSRRWIGGMPDVPRVVRGMARQMLAHRGN